MIVDEHTADRHAIIDVLHRYGIAIDSKDWSTFHELFDEDAISDYGYDIPPVHGASALTEFMQVHHVDIVSQHSITNVVLDFDRDVVRARSYVMATFAFNQDGKMSYRVGGYYDDELVKSAQRWRIRRRTFREYWSEGERPDVKDVEAVTAVRPE